MKKVTDLMKNNVFMPYLKGIIPSIIVSTSFIILALIGVWFPLVLGGYLVYAAINAYQKNITPKTYLKNSMIMIITITVFVWLYHYAGGYGLAGLLIAVLIVSGVLIYKRRRLILELVRLWEKTFLGMTMEERVEKKKQEMKK